MDGRGGPGRVVDRGLGLYRLRPRLVRRAEASPAADRAVARTGPFYLVCAGRRPQGVLDPDPVLPFPTIPADRPGNAVEAQDRCQRSRAFVGVDQSRGSTLGISQYRGWRAALHRVAGALQLAAVSADDDC